MRNPLEGNALSTSHYGEGEGGTTSHGYGNYFLFDQQINKENYYDDWSGIKKAAQNDGFFIRLKRLFCESVL